MSEQVWHPSKRQRPTAMDKYRQHVNDQFKLTLHDTNDLQKWSVDKPHDFWVNLYTYLSLVPSLPSSIKKAYDDTIPMSRIPAFFPGLHINYAENALFGNRNPEAPALIDVTEGKDIYQQEVQALTWHQFRERVRQVASALRHCGIKGGDRVAALVATSSWAVILFHATVSIGAIFTSISPELGAEGCVSRLQQVSPSLLFVDSHSVYRGKAVSTAHKVGPILSRLTPRPDVYVIPRASDDSHQFPAMDEFLAKSNPQEELSFTRVPFNYPLMICYSSGTTGAPKCIVHQHGIVLQYKKSAMLHNCLTAKDVVSQYSSTSWIVFYGMCGNLTVGSTLVLYNGSPLYPDAKQLLRLCDRYRVSFLGLSPRLLLEMEMTGTKPREEFDLSALRTVHSTGAPLSIEQYKWFYRSFPSIVQVCNVSGGTETATAIIAMDPSGPINTGEMQIASLGCDLDVADEVTGESIAHTGKAGEMVIRKPFPSMPCFFWGDNNGSKYKAAYFERFDTVDVWAQHDWLSKSPETGGWIMHGRSDAVLSRFSSIGIQNSHITDGCTYPSGIRFGSGEIYAIIEAEPLMGCFSNSLCVGRRRPQDTDEQVFLFLVMRPGIQLTREIRDQFKTAISSGLSPRHVPKFVLAVPDIPTTINGKRVEVAVKQVISGRDVTPSATIQNPESVGYFKRFRDIEREPLDGGKL